MVSLAEMKTQLGELEEQKLKLKEEIRKTDQSLKVSLGGIGIGVLLLLLSPLAGVIVILAAGAIAVFYAVKKSSDQDKLETLESEIHKLEISMA
jgi:hypothetical protein